MGQRREERRGEVKSLDKLWFKKGTIKKKKIEKKTFVEIRKQRRRKSDQEEKFEKLVDKQECNTVHWGLNQTFLGLLYKMENQNNSGLKF